MKLIKAFCEIRFEASFMFDDGKTKNDISKELKKEFEIVQVDNEQKGIIFLNPVKTSNFQVYRDRLVVDIDNPTNLTKLKSLSAATIPYVLRRLDVNETLRIGFRAQYADETVNSPVETSKFLINMFFNERLASFVGNENFDHLPKLGFMIPVTHEMFMMFSTGYHYKFNSNQLKNTGNILLSELDNVEPLFDLDVFTEIPKNPDQINGVLGAMITQVENNLNKLRYNL